MRVSIFFLPPVYKQAQASLMYDKKHHLDTQQTASELPACERGHPRPASPSLPLMDTWASPSKIRLVWASSADWLTTYQQSCEKVSCYGSRWTPLLLALFQRWLYLGGIMYPLPTSYWTDDNHLPNCCKHVWWCLPNSKETLLPRKQHFCLHYICTKPHPLARVDRSGCTHDTTLNLGIVGWPPSEMLIEEHRKLFCREIQK